MKITFGRDKQRAMAREEMTGTGRLGSRVLLTIRRDVVSITFSWTMSLPTG